MSEQYNPELHGFLTGHRGGSEAQVLLQRMIRIPGRPASRHAFQEERALRWVLSGCHPIPDYVKIRHLVSLRRRWHRTGSYLGWGNRYTRALEWAIVEARHG